MSLKSMYSKSITGAALAPVSGSLNVYSATVSPVRHTVKTISTTADVIEKVSWSYMTSFSF